MYTSNACKMNCFKLMLHYQVDAINSIQIKFISVGSNLVSFKKYILSGHQHYLILRGHILIEQDNAHNI